jgi:hypothetical protein
MTDTGTKGILIRDVPEDKLRIMKASAALSGMSLQAWCLQVLLNQIAQDSQQGVGGTFTLVMTPAASTPAAPAEPQAHK